MKRLLAVLGLLAVLAGAVGLPTSPAGAAENTDARYIDLSFARLAYEDESDSLRLTTRNSGWVFFDPTFAGGDGHFNINVSFAASGGAVYSYNTGMAFDDVRERIWSTRMSGEGANESVSFTILFGVFAWGRFRFESGLTTHDITFFGRVTPTFPGS